MRIKLKSIKVDPELKQMLELADKDIKIVITVFQMFKKLEERLNKQRYAINKKAQIIFLKMITKISERKKFTERIIGRLNIAEEMIIKLGDMQKKLCKMKNRQKRENNNNNKQEDQENY